MSGCLHLLARVFRRTGRRPLRVLEVGAGDGRLAGRVRQELRGQGIEADLFVLDRRMKHLQAAHSRSDGRLRPWSHTAIEISLLWVCKFIFGVLAPDTPVRFLNRNVRADQKLSPRPPTLATVSRRERRIHRIEPQKGY
ncbi:MAG TPA: hypothetical protein VG206_09120 [Terriglobia bacterium]|nr:hypothetical protein [Terriglobia bacterium]